MRGVLPNGGYLLHTPCDMKVLNGGKFGSSGTLCCLHYPLQGLCQMLSSFHSRWWDSWLVTLNIAEVFKPWVMTLRRVVCWTWASQCQKVPVMVFSQEKEALSPRALQMKQQKTVQLCRKQQISTEKIVKVMHANIVAVLLALQRKCRSLE